MKINFRSMRLLVLASTGSLILLASCSKNSNSSVSTGVQLPAEAIRGTTLPGGNVKGVMLTDSTYTVNGDITVLKGDTLTVQPGATINIPGNHAFYIQGVFQSLGTSAKPVVFSAPSGTPGAWGGFQADSCQGFSAYWTKFLWAGGVDSTGSTRATIEIDVPIPIDIEDCWFVGGQDNAIGVSAAATVKILRNTILNEGTTDGEGIDFHSGVQGVIAYNVIWGGAGSAIKIYTSKTAPTQETDIACYNNTCADNGFRRGAAEPGRGVLVDAFSKAQVYNNILANNYWSMDVTTSSDFAHTTYGYNWFYVTVDSLRQFMYPAGEEGVIQSTDIIDSVHLSANNPMFVNYPTPPSLSRDVPKTLDFHLQSGSPALGKGSTSAITSLPAGAPALSSDLGAYVSDTTGGKGNRHGAGY
jgi:hypothetical protein